MPRKKAVEQVEGTEVKVAAEVSENADSGESPKNAADKKHKSKANKTDLHGGGMAAKDDLQSNIKKPDIKLSEESGKVPDETSDEADFADYADDVGLGFGSDTAGGGHFDVADVDAADVDADVDNTEVDVDNTDVFVGADNASIFADANANSGVVPDANSVQTTPVSTPAPGQARQRNQSPAPVLTLEVGGEVVTQKDKYDTIWHEIKNSRVTGTHLTGILGKVERLESGALISIVDYQGQRIAIPLKEMMIVLNRPSYQSDDEYNERVARVLNRMMGAEIDFVVRGITGEGEERAAVASRKAAMLRLRRRYYLTDVANGKPLVYPDRIVEARIIAVSERAIRVEVFGVDASIRNEALSWGYVGDARDKYFVGDSVQVRVTGVIGDTPENLRIRADIRSLTTDDTREKLMALKPRTNCIGKVTDVRQGVIFINLIDGVRAISHKCFDNRRPGKGDDVLFVCTRVDEDSGVALGVISRIIKRNI